MPPSAAGFAHCPEPAPDWPRPVEIRPLASSLPANILRFYIHFSAPAEADFERDQLCLRSANGKVIPDAFLVLNEELWSADGRRLTFLLEPGRIKRGIGSAMGREAALVPGEAYRLEVATPAGALYKAFKALLPVTEPMSAADWEFRAPAAGSRQPLMVAFGRLMDDATLIDELDVQGPDAERLDPYSTRSAHRDCPVRLRGEE